MIRNSKGACTIALIGSLAFSTVAAAQTSSWTGLYLGFNAGYAGSDSSFSGSVGPGGYFADSSVASINRNSGFSLSDKSFTGGVQAGYNMQTGSLVWGLEADINYLDIRARRTFTTTYPCCAPTTYTLQDGIGTDWFATVRARAGFAAGSALIYVTGGLALTTLNYANTFADTYTPIPGQSVTISDMKTGWTIGGGVEWALSRNWSIKGEYLWADFGSLESAQRIGAPVANPTRLYSHSADFTLQTARFGVNYRY